MTDRIGRKLDPAWTLEEVQASFSRIATLGEEVMALPEADGRSTAAPMELKANVDGLLEAVSEGLQIDSEVLAHTLGVSCKQIAIRVDDPRYPKAAIEFLSLAVDLSFQAVPAEGNLDSFLFCLVTYLRCANYFEIADPGLLRIEPMLRFASRATSFAASLYAYKSWAYLTQLLTIEARIDSVRSDREKLLRAQAAAARAQSYEVPTNDEEAALLAASSEVFAVLIDVGLERDSVEAAAKLDAILERRSALDAAFASAGRPPQGWRTVLLSRITSACSEPDRVLGVWAAHWLTMEDWVTTTLDWLNSGEINGISDLATIEPSWVGQAWVVVLRHVDPLLKREILALSKYEDRVKDDFTIEQLAGMVNDIVAVQAEVARLADVDFGCVAAATSLIGRSEMSRAELERFGEEAFDEDEQAALMDSLGLDADGQPKQSARPTRRERVDDLLRRSAALRVDPGTDEEIVAFFLEATAEVIEGPFDHPVPQLIEGLVSSAASLPPSQARTQALTGLVFAATAEPAPWSSSALEGLHALVMHTCGQLLQSSHLASADSRRALYLFVLSAESFLPGSFSEAQLLEVLRRCLGDAAGDLEILGQANALVELSVARRSEGGLWDAVDLRAALKAWEAARASGTILFRSEAALLLVRVWLLVGTDVVPEGDEDRVRDALQLLVDDVLVGLTADIQRIYVVARLAGFSILHETLGLSTADGDELTLNVAERALAAVGQVGWEAVARILIRLCGSPLAVNAHARRLAGLARDVMPQLLENDLRDLWFELAVAFCLGFKNIDNRAVSTAEERAGLLTECVASGGLTRADGEIRVLATFCICETLSGLGHWMTSLTIYERLVEEMRSEPGLSASTVAAVDVNRARTGSVVAALVGDADRAVRELSEMRTKVRDPSFTTDHLDVLATELVAAAAVMQLAPSERARSIASGVVTECLALTEQEPTSLSGAAYVSFIRLACAVIAPGAADVKRVEAAAVAGAARAREEAGAGDPRLAAVLREVDLRLASLRLDTHGVYNGFRAIIAHQDVSRLSARSYLDLMSKSPVAGALTGAIDVLVDQGHLRTAAELLDELPGRTMRLAAGTAFGPSSRQSGEGERLVAALARETIEEVGIADPGPALGPRSRWHDLGEADQAILWDESQWASMLGTPEGQPVDGEGQSRAVVRAWSSERSAIRLLVTTPDGAAAHIDADRDAASLPRPDYWDEALIEAWAQSRSHATDGRRGSERVAGTLAAQLQEAVYRGAAGRIVSIIDFTETAYAVPMLREVLLASADGRPDRGVSTSPGARRRGLRDTRQVRERAAVHIGDWSGTLVGPWLEAAYASSLVGRDIQCRFPGEVSPTVSEEAPELLIISSHGALAAERPDHLGELRFGTNSLGMEEASSSVVPAPRVALLGACEVGRTHTRADELHGASLPSMLLHRGVEAVTAPVSPVDDLSSAVLVTRALFHFQSVGAELAVSAALSEVRGWNGGEVERWMTSLVAGFAASPFADRVPWPRHLVDAHCRGWLEALEGSGIAPRLRPYVATSW